MKMTNFAQKIIDFVAPKFKPRWEVYNELLCDNLDKNKVWIDVGCGQNEWVINFGDRAKYAVGTDLDKPNNDSPFIEAPANQLPFEDGFADVISLRFVVEHLQTIESDMAEFARVLKPGGKLIILTSNLANPFIKVAQYIPTKFKTPFLSKTFKVPEEKVFPTTHPLNKPSDYKKHYGTMQLISIEYISDLNTVNFPMFIAFMLWHVMTTPKFMHQFRTNILAVFQKQIAK